MTRHGCAPRLSMRGVAVRYGETLALDGADFEVAPGEARALLGAAQAIHTFDAGHGHRDRVRLTA
jgi:ABC-type transporter Mla maintaining outer membrane lipid asymmetry ATPase subunit MlaF